VVWESRVARAGFYRSPADVDKPLPASAAARAIGLP